MTQANSGYLCPKLPCQPRLALPTVTSFIAPLFYCPSCLLPTPNGQWVTLHQTPHSSPEPQEVNNMDFVQEFLSLNPEILFKVSEAEVSLKNAKHAPPTTLLIILIAIFIIVLATLIIFVGGLLSWCCRTSPSQPEQSNTSVTVTQTA